MEAIAKIIGIVLGIIAVAFVLSLLFAFPIMWLWNYLMPDLFGLKEIGLWQSFCISLLCSFLFKGDGSSNSKND